MPSPLTTQIIKHNQEPMFKTGYTEQEVKEIIQELSEFFFETHKKKPIALTKNRCIHIGNMFINKKFNQ